MIADIHPFDRILIANRGEIALRIQRACRQLGLACVQAYSSADAGAPYVRCADEAICIGPAPSRQSYLSSAAILLAARASGARAVHPGYGFLSENADFAARLEAAGMTLIGPTSDAMRVLGDKISAKRAMISSGVPCVPGYEGALAADDAALAIASDLGYPLIIKAAGGGGGRGMRVVHNPEELLGAIRITREEAERAFANANVYMERYLQRPRHVEIQVLCDHHGNGVWLGARDCSTQRRHQKVIEEAPAPNVDPALIARVGKLCVDACRQIGYRGLGTFEFLHEDGELFFIEMNTRLQVEHTITEMTSGLDLVELQIRVAQGERLPFTQEEVEVSGHSIECRINAEDPTTFVPSPGTVEFFHAPGGPGIRVDSHVSSGYAIPSHYDSMIAKVITWGKTREQAIVRMEGALREMKIEGVKSNIPLHRDVLQSSEFRRGGMSIHFLERMLDDRRRSQGANKQA
ncbi:acetyl-CoA carboxylase biotin carboxylase subunit [Paraburkholderia caledonica]|uniref:Biotin carboxylase n=1 Tax=Paraburkholderia caledonica TaxID=134536 RepID=A0AB73INI4_9BURK|nr:acetyl-CoA carboxylase biotin carboxylase subunit [Paraburkholderia caledonica]